MTVLFLHVPRTGGSTLWASLRRTYRRKKVLDFHYRSIDEEMERFKQLSADKRASYTLIRGHMGYGLHNWIDGDVAYLTLLRSPVERVISEYAYALDRPTHHSHAFLVENGITLRQYVEQGISTSANNQMVRLLSGGTDNSRFPRDFRVVPFGQCTQAMLDAAVTNLAHCHVGITEQLDRSIANFRHTFGWAPRKPEYLNGSHHQPSLEDIEDALPSIRRYNALDQALYDVAEAQFKGIAA